MVRARGRRRGGRIVRWAPERPFTGLTLAGVARAGADDPAAQARADQLFRNPFRPIFRGELGKGARESRRAGKLGAAFPASAANSAKARAKVAALGSSERRSQPQIRRKVRSPSTRSIRAAVVGMASTAVATTARAIGGRVSGERPRPRGGGAPTASNPRVSRRMISRSSWAVTGSISCSSHGKSSGCRLIHPPHYRLLSLTMPIPETNHQNLKRNDSRMQWKTAVLFTWKSTST